MRIHSKINEIIYLLPALPAIYLYSAKANETAFLFGQGKALVLN